MTDFEKQGEELRTKAKEVVLKFMKSMNNKGLTQTDIFRECGLDWGDHSNAKSTQQQYWVVALLRQLEKENQIFRDEAKKWRLL